MFELIRKSKLDRRLEAMECGFHLFCEGKKSSPDPPDYSEIAAASAEAAEIQAAVALEQLDWAKEQWVDQKAVLDQVVESTLPMMETQWANAQADRARYEELYQPLEEDYLAKAAGWDTKQRRDAEAARSQSEISQQFDAQRKNALQRLESYGVDPSQTRNAALDLGVRVEQAKAMAQGADVARKNTEREGMGMIGESINVGRGMASQGLQHAGQSLAASQAAQTGAAGWQGASSAMGSPSSWMAGSDRSLGTWGNALTGGYNAQLGAYNADVANTGGWLNLAGMLGGGYLAGKFAEGGEVGVLPTSPREISGPGGPKDDQVTIAASDGEYMIPEEVVRRKGTEFFDKLIEKTHTDLAERAQAAQVAPNGGVAIPPPSGDVPTANDIPPGGIPGMAEGGEITDRLGAFYGPMTQTESQVVMPGAQPGVFEQYRSEYDPTEGDAANQQHTDLFNTFDMDQQMNYGGNNNPIDDRQRFIERYGQRENPGVIAGRVSYTERPEVSDMRNWVSWRKAQREQKGLNKDAQLQLKKQAMANQQKWQGGGDGPAFIRPGRVTTGDVAAGPAAAAYQQRFDTRMADLRARLPALKAKYGIGE